jgi:hypothetical protein
MLASGCKHAVDVIAHQEVSSMPANAKITRACINPPGKDNRDAYNSEWVELQVGSESDLSGHIVEHLINPKTQQQGWSVYFQFDTGESFPAGSHIRIHSGAGTAKQDGKTYHRYVADSDEKGQWRLNNDGDAIRLLDPHGTKLDEKAFNGLEGYCDEAGSNDSGPQKKPQTQYA